MSKRISLTLIVGLLAVALLAACQTAAPAAEPTPVAASEVAAPTAAPEEEAAEAGEDAAIDAQRSAESPAAGNGAAIFTIVPEGTEARFYIDEVLMGDDVTVVGVTSLVEGELTVDPADPASATVGVITIDASDLTTDNERRNGAIRRFVLQTNDEANQYITFTPTGIDGLPDSVTVGEPFSFTVTGDLQIRDVVNPETFEMTVTPVSETEIAGTGQTTVQRGNYGLTIPSVPSVADVSEEVILELEFVARQ